MYKDTPKVVVRDEDIILQWQEESGTKRDFPLVLPAKKDVFQEKTTILFVGFFLDFKRKNIHRKRPTDIRSYQEDPFPDTPVVYGKFQRRVFFLELRYVPDIPKQFCAIP